MLQKFNVYFGIIISQSHDIIKKSTKLYLQYLTNSEVNKT